MEKFLEIFITIFFRKKFDFFRMFFFENRRYDPCYHRVLRFELYIRTQHKFLRSMMVLENSVRHHVTHTETTKSTHAG